MMRPKRLALDVLGALAVLAMIVFGVALCIGIVWGGWLLIAPR